MKQPGEQASAGIKIAVQHQTLSDKNVICPALMYQSRTFSPALYH